MTHDELAQALLDAVRAQDFGATPDALQGGRPVEAFPSIDLAVAAFPSGAAPVSANVLFSREHPQGFAARIGPGCGAVADVHYLADQRDAELRSVAWLPGADWSRMSWRTLAGAGGVRFVAPYPASLLKMLVAVGIALQVEGGRLDWPQAELEAMIAWSDDAATTALVALLHRLGGVAPLQRRLTECGLSTLRLEGTRADGGWRNGEGAGVGRIQMTAWDSVRMMWLLDADDAPAPPWLPQDTVLLGTEGRARLRAWMAAQRCNEILSSESLRGVPGWRSGLPDEVAFAHKTGTTENYASDAGIVRARSPQRRHYLVAVLSNLGRRYAPDSRCATTWRLPALGAEIDSVMAAWMEA